MGWAAVLFLVVGFALNFFAGKMLFDRRNEFGVEEYSSYASAVGTSILSRVVSAIGGILIFLGLVFGLFSFLTGK